MPAEIDALLDRVGLLEKRAVIIDDASLWAVRWDLMILLAVPGVLVVMAWRFFRWE
jgi:hypothetical protein